MKLWKIALFVMVSLVAASCGTYQLTSYEPQKDYFQTITSSYELKRKMETDWLFRQNYITFATNQPRSWYNKYYSQNFMFKRNFSAFDFYWNRHEIWWNWGFNSHNWWGHEWYVPKFYNWESSDIAWHKSRRSSNVTVTKKRKNKVDVVYNKLKTIVKNNPNRSYSNVAINTNRSIRNYDEPKFTPRLDPNNGPVIRNNFNRNNSSTPPDITTRPSGAVLLKGKK